MDQARQRHRDATMPPKTCTAATMIRGSRDGSRRSV
jgi:hypothetical protein